MEEPVQFSVIIISWNTCDLTLAAIRSVNLQNDPRVEVLVVDNASSDDTVEKIREFFPKVRLMINESNLGFAAANNLAMKTARGEYFVLLNSDAELSSPNIFDALQDAFAGRPLVGVIGGKLVLPSAKIQSVGREFLTLKRVIKEQLLFVSAKPAKPARIDYVDGAFLAVRRAVVKQVGGLDERLFMYGEDMEWCLRIKNAGWRIVVLPELVIKHHHGAAAKQNFRAMLVHSTLNNCRFLARFKSIAEAKAAFDIFLTGMALRIPLSLLRRNSLAGDYLAGLIATFKLRPKLKILLNNGRSDIPV